MGMLRSLAAEVLRLSGPSMALLKPRLESKHSSEGLHSGKFRLPPPGFRLASIVHLNAPRGAQGCLVHTIVLL